MLCGLQEQFIICLYYISAQYWCATNHQTIPVSGVYEQCVHVYGRSAVLGLRVCLAYSQYTPNTFGQLPALGCIVTRNYIM